MVKPVILGVDPGTTVGLALLDIDGKILKVKSERNISIDEIITEIASVGSPAVVATDKALAPALVSKLATILGARLFTPDNDLPVDKKRELADGWRTKNDHERDALASAVYAYYNFQNKIRRIEKQVMDQLEEIKARVLKGEKVSDIASAWEVDAKKEEDLQSKYEGLMKENRRLRGLLEAKGPVSFKPLEEAYERRIRGAEMVLEGIRRGGLVLIKEVPSLNYVDLRNQDIRGGDLIYSRSGEYDSKGIRFLESRGAGCIITAAGIETLLPTADPKDIKISRWGSFFFADPLEIKGKSHTNKEIKGRDLEEMITTYRSGRR